MYNDINFHILLTIDGKVKMTSIFRIHFNKENGVYMDYLCQDSFILKNKYFMKRFNPFWPVLYSDQASNPSRLVPLYCVKQHRLSGKRRKMSKNGKAIPLRMIHTKICENPAETEPITCPL